MLLGFFILESFDTVNKYQACKTTMQLSGKTYFKGTLFRVFLQLVEVDDLHVFLSFGLLV